MQKCILDLLINKLTYASKVTCNLIIRYPKYSQPSTLNSFCANFISFQPIIFIMLCSIQFNNKPCFMAIKIHDIIVDHFLSQEPYRIGTQKIVPQMSLFLGHISTQCFRIFSQVDIVFSLHIVPLILLNQACLALRPPCLKGAGGPQGRLGDQLCSNVGSLYF